MSNNGGKIKLKFSNCTELNFNSTGMQNKNYSKYKELIIGGRENNPNSKQVNNADLTSSATSITTNNKRFNSTTSRNNNFPHINELKKSKVTQIGAEPDFTKINLNLKKDVLKFYDNNLKRLKVEEDILKSKSPLPFNLGLNKETAHNLNTTTQELCLHRPKQFVISDSNILHNDISSNNNTAKSPLATQTPSNQLTFNKKQQMNLYHDLAKKLKSGKGTFRQINFTTDEEVRVFKDPFNQMIKSCNSMVSYSNNDNIVHAAHGLSSGTERLSSIGLTKTTKDISSICSSKKSSNNHITLHQNSIEGPEDLHYFYVGILKSNKRLAYKFDKSSANEEDSDDII